MPPPYPAIDLISNSWQPFGGQPLVAGDGPLQVEVHALAAEPGAEVVVTLDDKVTLEVKVCPAFRHLRAHGREVVPCFCEHCHYISAAIGEPAGIKVEIEGGNGSCRQVFSK